MKTKTFIDGIKEAIKIVKQIEEKHCPAPYDCNCSNCNNNNIRKKEVLNKLNKAIKQ